MYVLKNFVNFKDLNYAFFFINKILIVVGTAIMFNFIFIFLKTLCI